jgi:zinc protease
MTMISNLLKNTLAGIALLAFSCTVQAAINLADPIPIGPQVKTGKLANGLTYYIQKNNRPEKRVELRLVVKVGSVVEDDDQQGLAHFTEHMAFNGSRHFKKHELISYLQSIGVKFGADLNAYTSFDETVYILPVPTDKKENLETGFLVLQDWAQGVLLNDVEIDQERGIILEEARLRKGANDRMTKVLLPEAFRGSKYAERLPIGKEAIIKDFKYDAIRRFYADWYRPDLMAVVVVGDIEPDQAEKMIQGYFSQLKNPLKERVRDYAPIPQRIESKGLVITDKEATNNIVMIRYPLRPAKADQSMFDYRQNTIQSLMEAMFAQRMQELTQQVNAPFLAGSSSLGQIVRGYEAYTSVVVLGRDGAQTAINAVVQENERARQFGFSAEELERAKKMRMRAFESMYSEREKTNSSVYAAEYIRNFLVQEALPGSVNEYAYQTELLPTIMLKEVNHYASQSIPDGGTKLVVYMGADKADAPTPLGVTLLQLVSAAEKMPVLAREEKKLASKLMQRPAVSGSIVSETHNAQLGLYELELSNGVKLILKPTDFKNDQVLMSAMRFGGQSLYDEADKFNAYYSNAIAGSMGLKDFSPTEVMKILAGKSSQVQTSSSYYVDKFSAFSSSADTETLFQLLYLRMSSPRKDNDLFDAYIKRSQDATKNAMANPEAIFNDQLVSTLYNHHSRLVYTARPEDFSNIQLERAMTIFGERFGSAKGLTFILVGSFDVEKIKPLLTAYLANLPVTDVASNYRDLGVRPVTGVVKKEVRVGREAKSRVSLTFTGVAAYSSEESLRFEAMLDVLNLRITDILREKMSLIYSGNASGSITREPYEHYRIGISLPCGPENTEKVITAMLGEIEKLKKQGPSQEELNKVKQNWFKEHKIDLRSNKYWLDDLQDSVLYGTDLAESLSFEARTNAMTAEDIQGATARYFNMENYLQAVMLPEHLNNSESIGIKK